MEVESKRGSAECAELLIAGTCREVDFEVVPLNCERDNQLTKVCVEHGRLAQSGRSIVTCEYMSLPGAQATEFADNLHLEGIS